MEHSEKKGHAARLNNNNINNNNSNNNNSYNNGNMDEKIVLTNGAVTSSSNGAFLQVNILFSKVEAHDFPRIAGGVKNLKKYLKQP